MVIKKRKKAHVHTKYAAWTGDHLLFQESCPHGCKKLKNRKETVLEKHQGAKITKEERSD